jgi:hypothetical protein
MTGYVVDASVAVKWFVPEEGSERAEALAGAGSRLIAPRLILTELANAFWKKVRTGLMTVADASSDLASVGRYFDEVVDHEDCLSDALAAACALKHPVYDLVYVELARRRGFSLVTADTRLMAVATRQAPTAPIMLLSQWQPTS